VHHVLLVEVGHSQSSVLLAAVTAAGSTLLSEASDVAFGAANFDDRLFRHFQAEIQQKYKGEVKPGRWGLF
jgi:molecular chaperone DnaK (HSP70)